MKAVVCVEPGKLAIENRPVPKPVPGDAVVAIRRIGVCGTDMHIYQGKHPFLEYPRVMGHELSAEVVEAPAGSGHRPGDVVFVNPYIACGGCIACRHGKPNCCVAIGVLGVHRDGGMCEHLALPAGNVMASHGIGVDAAAMVEFLSIGAHAVCRGRVEAGERVLVTGAGPIGLGVAFFAKLRGAEVTCLDLRADRLAFAQRHVGARPVTAGEDADEQLARITNGEFFDAVFDATGHAASMERGFGYVAHGGRYILVSVVKDEITFSDPEFHKREMSLIGSRNALAADFETVVRAIGDGKVPVEALATHRAALTDVPARMPAWTEPAAGVVKALIEVG